MMLTYGKPVWRLTKDDTGWVGNVWDDAERRMAELRDIFFGLADHTAG
jgi:hypothetical protein